MTVLRKMNRFTKNYFQSVRTAPTVPAVCPRVSVAITPRATTYQARAGVRPGGGDKRATKVHLFVSKVVIQNCNTVACNDKTAKQ